MPILFILVVFILPALYLRCLKPNVGRRNRMRCFEDVYIAHRGLFGNGTEAPENSLPAFRKAVKAGYGIELDVQLTADRQLVVFHDASLKRLCGVEKGVAQCTYEELQRYPIGMSQARIPLFQDALRCIGGKVPLIVEIKPEGDCAGAARMLAEQMKGYSGAYCVESFHPLVVAWYRKNHPEVMRGQLSTNYRKDGVELPSLFRFLLTNLLLNGYAKPDFIAYNHKYAGQFSYRLCRKLYPVENVAWTIKSQEELNRAKHLFQVLIFDSFLPEGRECCVGSRQECRPV